MRSSLRVLLPQPHSTAAPARAKFFPSRCRHRGRPQPPPKPEVFPFHRHRSRGLPHQPPPPQSTVAPAEAEVVPSRRCHRTPPLPCDVDLADCTALIQGTLLFFGLWEVSVHLCKLIIPTTYSKGFRPTVLEHQYLRSFSGGKHMVFFFIFKTYGVANFKKKCLSQFLHLLSGTTITLAEQGEVHMQ